jgi:spore coat protein U-like protein
VGERASVRSPTIFLILFWGEQMPSARYIFAASVAALACMQSAQAFAQPATLDLRGQISPKCELLSAPAANVGSSANFTRPGRSEMSFQIVCNTEMVAHIESSHGGFLNQPARNAGLTGGQDLLDYRIGVALEGRALLGSVRASELKRTPGLGELEAGRLVAEDAELRVSLEWDGSERLYAGSYADTLTVTVRPAA